MQNKTLNSLIISLSFLLAWPVVASQVNINDILAEIRQTQGVASDKEIACNKITDDQFEKLGEIAMAVAHPDPEEHEKVEIMMGGEGSAMLRTAHIKMGREYFCGSGEMMMAMGSPTMNQNMMSNNSSLANWPENKNLNNDGQWQNHMSYMGAGWAFVILVWGLIIAIIVMTIKWFRCQSTCGVVKKPALDILKERYVKGEISKEEFLEKKKDLN